MISKRILLLAFLVWLTDAVSKWWALTHLPNVPVALIPGVFFLWLASNPGGSYGLSREFMELCLTLPATLVFLCYLALARREKLGYRPSTLMQIGMACLTGGTISNWSERVVYQHVTDFCFTPFWSCIWNLADMFISTGFMLIAIDVFLIARKHRLNKRSSASTESA
jgi:lipoprotein signal peptidase